jgi:hypothetical protein
MHHEDCASILSIQAATAYSRTVQPVETYWLGFTGICHWRILFSLIEPAYNSISSRHTGTTYPHPWSPYLRRMEFACICIMEEVSRRIRLSVRQKTLEPEGREPAFLGLVLQSLEKSLKDSVGLSSLCQMP